ncbi:hypothetical protein BDN72DRAFT_737518, partial [Pluteus cervinus]
TTNTLPIPPLHHQPNLQGIIPQTDNEIRLAAALRKAESENKYLRDRNLTLQSSNLFNEVYCGKARNELERQDNKKTKGKGRGKLTGMPCMVTGDVFYEEV